MFFREVGQNLFKNIHAIGQNYLLNLNKRNHWSKIALALKGGNNSGEARGLKNEIFERVM